eukprot:g10470.t1
MWPKLMLLLCLPLYRLTGVSSSDEGPVPVVSGPGQPLEEPPTTPSAQQAPIAIVIMALARSGSTLMGQMFRQNEDLLYFYEPCRASGGGVLGHHDSLVREDCFALARRLTRCEFTLQDSDRLTVDESAAGYNSPAAANVHRAVKESRHNANIKGEDALVRAHDNLMDKCKTSRAVATKTIRLLDGVGDALKYDTTGMHVLQLVRDPRAVTRSQLIMRGLKGFKSVLPNARELESIDDWKERQKETRRAVGQYVCQNYRMQLDSSESVDVDKYLRIRYEDFALLPQMVAELIYCWAGLGKVPPGLVAWIDANTKMENCEDPTRRQLAVAAGSLGDSLGGDYFGARQETAAAVASLVGDGGGVQGPRETARGGVAGPPPPLRPTRAGNLRHGNRFAAASALGVERSVSSRLPQRQDQGSPSGVVMVAPGKTEGAVDSGGPDSRRLDSATRGGEGAAAAGREGNDHDAFTLEQNPARRVAEENCDNEKTSVQSPFSTKRHSSQMIDLWRTQMPEQDAVAIWEACLDSHVMEELNYSM